MRLLTILHRQGLIAINYPARKFGIGRHCTVTDAKKLCPELICQHVATWREGEDVWAYHDDAAANIASDKVSLDPYRLQCRKILALVKESLPSNLQKVEKASIDEVFLDLSAQIHSILLERFSELKGPPPYDDPTEKLPLPDISALDWKADALVDLDATETETQDPDWDDVAILIGSEIVRDIRATIREKLKYTCSAGIASNKMLSKLGSGHKKPNAQTVVRNRAIQQFLSGFKFQKIRNLGGKLGDQVAETFSTESVGDLLLIPIEQFKLKLGDDTGVWLHNTIRGIDTSEVNPRTQIKSMLSAKSFRPSINSFEQAAKWLRIFAGDIFSRLVEEGVLENKRRPRTINLHHRHGGQTRSRQGPIPQGKPIDEETLFDLSKNLLSQIILEGRVWPCANLSLSVASFEDGITGNMGISAFLLKGDEAQALKKHSRGPLDESTLSIPPEKRRKLETKGIQQFFSKQRASSETLTGVSDGSETYEKHAGRSTSDVDEAADAQNQDQYAQKPITDFMCQRCNISLESADALVSHHDWHLAKELQEDEERGRSAFANHSSSPAAATTSRPGAKSAAAAPSKRVAKGKKMEAGQSKLKFG